MAKLNMKNTIENQINQRTDLTQNYEGGKAFNMSDKLKLYSMVSSWLVNEPKFYKEIDENNQVISENQDPIIYKTIENMLKTDPEFVLKLAIYARNKLYLRSAPEVLLVESSLNGGKSFVRKATPQIVTRPDQLANCIAYLQSKIGHIGNKSDKGSMPNSLKRGLADTFQNFNEYGFAKYDIKTRAVKLKDVAKLVHPKPKDKEQGTLFKKIFDDNLETPRTWETIISKGSNTENWTEASKVMPYMALLRNLRNLLNHNVDMNSILIKLTDPAQVARSKQFPFRFFSAYKQVQEFTQSVHSNKTLDAIETALELSIRNVPKLSGTTFITSDNSGSMQSPISVNSSVDYVDIANLMMAMAGRICDDSITSVFGNSHKVVNLPSKSGIISNMQRAKNTDVGYATNAYLTIRYLLRNKIKVDRIMLFSDMQCYSSNYMSYGGESFFEDLVKYRRQVNPDVFVYSFDLAGYGTLQVPEGDKNTCLIAGWSDKVLNYIPIFESDGKTALDEIEKIQI